MDLTQKIKKKKKNKNIPPFLFPFFIHQTIKKMNDSSLPWHEKYIWARGGKAADFYTYIAYFFATIVVGQLTLQAPKNPKNLRKMFTHRGLMFNLHSLTGFWFLFHGFLVYWLKFVGNGFILDLEWVKKKKEKLKFF